MRLIKLYCSRIYNVRLTTFKCRRLHYCLFLFSLCWSHLRREIIWGSDLGKPEKEIPGAVLICCTIDQARPLTVWSSHTRSSKPLRICESFFKWFVARFFARTWQFWFIIEKWELKTEGSKFGFRYSNFGPGSFRDQNCGLTPWT